ncbi:40S ribosomal protein S12 [Diplonema papillatum]|nr:40S ribosomal protein S12 [Diplonema papillatum]KAJ9442951.1 40S ribosomal protein S12 [Diplonema papillatum]KAJ9442952.1 40S ribosomal protein S12 [Diplonema papillatum]
MADATENMVPETDVVEDHVPEEDAEPEDMNAALQQVLKRARCHKGLTRGLRETVKALDKKIAHLCVLAEDCNESAYTGLIEALCDEHGIDLIKVPEKKKLGEWVGLAKYDSAAQIRKVIGASCVAVTDYGEKSKALDMILGHFNH